jgi:hypothetical protein
MTDDECGPVGGMRTGGGTEVLGGNLLQRHLVPTQILHDLSWAQLWEAADYPRELCRALRVKVSMPVKIQIMPSGTQLPGDHNLN